MASAGEGDSCFPVQSPEAKLHVRREPCSPGEMLLIGGEIVDASIDGEASD